ncbi:hypothetical protein Pfo_002353 [Paulownia fortunei]|nr:hypothetical protein Pfo_002353 [Paulownia fortunei]
MCTLTQVPGRTHTPLPPPPLILRLLLLIVGIVNYKLVCKKRVVFFQLISIVCPRADDEPVDPKRELEDRCKAPCTRPLKEYQACAKRIQGDESGHKHCTGQYFDYWRCVDKCVATKLFSYLK